MEEQESIIPGRHVGPIKMTINEKTVTEDEKAIKVEKLPEGEKIQEVEKLPEGEISLEERIVGELKKRGYTITTAESCTGGLLAGRIINAAGASSVYKEGYITYSNEAKEKILHVPHNLLETFGAVSLETAASMAWGAAKEAKAQVALSTTGIAGPAGGTRDKPVGLVYIGCCINGEMTVGECRFSGNRQENRMSTVDKALCILWEKLRKNKKVLDDSIRI